MDREGRKKLIFVGWAAELSIHYPFVYIKKFDIICLQETYVTENKAEEWKKEWSGEFFLPPIL